MSLVPSPFAEVIVSRIRLGASAILILALVSFAGGQDPKKDPNQPDPNQPKAPKKDEGKKDEPKKDDGKKDPAPMVKGELFETKFEAGKSFYQESSTTLKQTIRVQGQTLTQDQSSTYFFKWTPEKEEGGKWYVKQTVEGVKKAIDISGNQFNYDSTKTDNPTSSNPGLTEVFSKLPGAEFTTVLDQNQKVVEVQGRQEFLDKIGAGNPQIKQVMGQILTEEALKDLCDPTFKLRPEDGQGREVGGEWQRKGTIDLGPIGKYEITYKYKYVGDATEADKAGQKKIEVNTELVYTAPDKKDQPGLLFRVIEGKLTSQPPKDKGPMGTIYYDPTAKRVASAEIKLTLSGSLTVSLGGTDTKVELTQEQTTSIKTSDTSLMTPAAKKDPMPPMPPMPPKK